MYAGHQLSKRDNPLEEDFGMTQQPQDRQYIVPPPVTYFPELLPLGNLPWERFEVFCEDLISKLPGVEEVHQYGGQGSTQRGIDIFADFENGERWAFQCKRRQSFSESDATTAIEDTTYNADRYILMLSRAAATGARDACDANPSWDVWDEQRHL